MKVYGYIHTAMFGSAPATKTRTGSDGPSRNRRFHRGTST